MLGDAAEAAGDFPAAVGYAREQAEIEPLFEEVARTLTRRLAAAGDRAGAVAAFESFRGKLRGELGMAPSAETRTLIDRVRAEPAPAVQRPAPTTAPPARLSARSRLRWSAQRRARAHGGCLAQRQRRRPPRARSPRRSWVGEDPLARGDGKRHARRGATVLAGRCFADAVAPYGPFAEALRPYAARPESLPGWIAFELARLVPGEGRVSPPPDGPADDARHRLFEAVAALLGDAARSAPVLLALEDFH